MQISSPLVFFGSGSLGLRSLEFLAERFAIELVVTKPRSDKARVEPAVITWCRDKDIAYITPTNRAELDEQLLPRHPQAQLGVVVDYGIIISDKLLRSFPLGIINSHFSLLPLLRGADPITFSILEGCEKTGVSLMRIVAAMDEGPLLAQESLSIPADATTPDLTESLLQLSLQMLDTYLPKYIIHDIAPFEQSRTIKPTYTRRLTKDDGLLDWTKSAERLEREIRAYAEWPKSYTQFDGKLAVITKAHIEPGGDDKPGTVLSDTGKLAVQCSDGRLVIDELVPAGKPPMSSKAYLNGYGLPKQVG